jgi:hypothetical protein
MRGIPASLADHAMAKSAHATRLFDKNQYIAMHNLLSAKPDMA